MDILILQSLNSQKIGAWP